MDELRVAGRPVLDKPEMIIEKESVSGAIEEYKKYFADEKVVNTLDYVFIVQAG